MENNDDIDKLFKNSFENMEFKPNDKDWLAMKDKMQKEGIISKPSGNKKGIYLWSFIALLFMGSIGMYFIFSNTPNSNELNPTLTQSAPSTQIEIQNANTETAVIKGDNKQLLLQNKIDNITKESKLTTSIIRDKIGHFGWSEDRRPKTEALPTSDFGLPTNNSTNSETYPASILMAEASSVVEANNLVLSDFNHLNTTTIHSIQTTVMKEKVADLSLIIKNENEKKRPIPCPVILGNTKKHLFYVGPYISADKNIYTMINNGDIADSDQLEGENNFQYTTGAIVGMSINSRVNIETGVLYAQKIKLNTTVIDGANTYSFNYNGKYIDVPIRAKIYLNKQFLRWYVMPGIIANINTPSGGSFKDDVSGDITYTINLMPQSVGISAQLGTGLEWTITDRISWYIEPSFKYALSPVVKHNTYELPIDHLINTISLGTGINFKF